MNNDIDARHSFLNSNGKLLLSGTAIVLMGGASITHAGSKK